MRPFIDISVALTETLPIWTGSPGVSRSAILSQANGDDANATELTMDVHCGTHIDAPRHFIDGGETVEQISLDRLNGPVYVARIEGPAVLHPADLEAAEIPAETKRLLVRTDNSAVADLYTSPFRTEYVAFSPAGAEWLRERGIDLIGIDYLSIQRFDDPPDAHITILGAGIVIIEGLRLTDVEAGWYDLVCMPILLAGAEAAPARVALRPQSQES